MLEILHVPIRLFVWVFCSIREFFTQLETSPLHILTLTWHSWSLRIELGFFITCHTYMYHETGQTFIIVISVRTRACCPAFGSGTVTTCFNDLGPFRPGIEHRSPACEANALWLRKLNTVCILHRFHLSV